MMLPVGLTSSLSMLVRYGASCWSDFHDLGLLKEPCCHCTCCTATAVAPCKLNHLGQHALVLHNHTYIHQMRVPLSHTQLLMSSGDQSLSTFIHKYTHAHIHMHKCAVQCSILLVSRAEADCPQCHILLWRMHHHWTICLITGPHASSLDDMPHHWTTCIITGSHALSLDHMHHYCTKCLTTAPHAPSLDH